MSFGSRLKDRRKRAGLTQSALARAIGVEPRTVQRWEKDETDGYLRHLVELSRALEVPADELLGPPEPEPEPERLDAIETELQRLTSIETELHELRVALAGFTRLAADPEGLRRAADALLESARPEQDSPPEDQPQA